MQLHLGKRKGERAAGCKYVQNPKGERNGFLQVETEPYKDETLAASSGRNTQDFFAVP